MDYFKKKGEERLLTNFSLNEISLAASAYKGIFKE